MLSLVDTSAAGNGIPLFAVALNQTMRARRQLTSRRSLNSSDQPRRSSRDPCT
jgi:hypothetical protein